MSVFSEFIKRGWRVVTEAHTVCWLYGLLPGVPSALSGWWSWYSGQPWPIITTITIVVFAALFLCLLTFLGYQRERSTTAPAQIKVTIRGACGPDVTLTEVYHLLHRAMPFPGFQDFLFKQLSNGAIQAWGRLAQSKNAWSERGPEQPIPSTYWTDSVFDWMTIANVPTMGDKLREIGARLSEKTKPGKGKETYYKVRFNTAQITQLYEKLAGGRS